MSSRNAIDPNAAHAGGWKEPGRHDLLKRLRLSRRRLGLCRNRSLRFRDTGGDDESQRSAQSEPQKRREWFEAETVNHALLGCTGGAIPNELS